MARVFSKHWPMKRANNLLPRIEETDNLRLAFWKASKGKRYAAEVLAYQAQLDERLLLLCKQIQEGVADVGAYRYFKVYEPKERQICASAFGEQVLHHALMNVCHDRFEKAQIYDSYASRKGKGTYAALERAQEFTRRYSWYLKLDVRQFFASIHHGVMKSQLARLFKEQRLLSLFFQIIDSYEAEPGRGVPIGNLTSQYFANHCLSGLDHYIKEELGIAAYVRYMDDMVLWHDDKEALKAACKAIDAYVSHQLRLALKPVQLNRCSSGVPFLGYRLFGSHRWLLQQSKRRFVRKINRALDAWDRLEMDDRRAAAHILPLLAFVKHADTRVFRKEVLLRRKRSNAQGL